jgi:opacity protein-like surface antigen
MKKLVLTVLFVFALSSMAMASPLTDFSKGKADLDINYRSDADLDVNPGINGVGQLGDIEFDSDSNLEWGFTYGIGNNWAMQYRQATPKGSLSLINEPTLSIDLEAKTKVEEYNALYKINKNFTAFTGIVKAAPSAKLSLTVPPVSGDIAIAGHDKNIWQFGLQAVAPFADKFTGYGIAAFGSDYRNLEAGIGYQLSKDVELNVNYRDMKIDDMTMVGLNIPPLGDVTSDVHQKGFGFGLTYKF